MERLLAKLARLRAITYTRLLSSNFYELGSRSLVVPPFRYCNLRGMQIGRNVLIHGFCWIQALPPGPGKEYPFIIIHDHANIGMGATISAAQKIVIGEHVLLGRNVHISDHGHEFHDVTLPIDMQEIRKTSEVRIGAETWIGQNAVILPGAAIGRHCVIGANSVVRSNIPDYSVAVGAPARIVERYNTETARWEAVGRA